MSAENFLVQPYDVRMLVVRADPDGMDDKRTLDVVQKTLGRTLSEYEVGKLRSDSGEQAITVTYGDAVIVRFIDPDPEAPSLIAVHEAFHAAVSILRHARVKFAPASEEAYAYLLTWLYGKLMEGVGNE